jgi:molecular chaperone GrpE
MEQKDYEAKEEKGFDENAASADTGGEGQQFKPLDLKAMKKDELIALAEALINENTELSRELESMKKEREKLDAVVEKARELSRMYASLSNDFDQYKKRNAEIEQTSFDKAVAEIALKIIPVYDNLKLALGSISDEKSREGVGMIYRQFGDIIASLGITEIKAEGQPFDPMLHNALMAEDTDDESLKGKVKAAFSDGYVFRDKVIKQSQVIVYR